MLGYGMLEMSTSKTTYIQSFINLFKQTKTKNLDGEVLLMTDLLTPPRLINKNTYQISLYGTLRL